MESWKLDRRKRALRDRLIDEGQRELRYRRAPGLDTGGPGADLVNDLAHHPHAFVFGCIADRQYPAPKAWAIPSIIQQRVGSFEIDDLAELDEAGWRRVIRTPSAAHRYPDRIALST
jgi:endonuclease-3